MDEAPLPQGLTSKTVKVKDALMHYLEAGTFDVPKLLRYANPGAIIGEAEVAWCETLPNLAAVKLGEGLHFLPEDRPGEIGVALKRWLKEV